MRYQVTKDEKFLAKNPHHIFNLNILITHLAISKVALELGGGNPFYFLMVPGISLLVIAYLYFHGQKVQTRGSWFVSAHWMLAWRRGRNLIISYAVAVVVLVLATILGNVFGGGLMMNDFSDSGSSTSIIQKIGMFFAGVVVFFTVLYNFLQTGISVYDAGKGIIDKKIERFLPRDANANVEIGEGDEPVKRDDEEQQADSEKSS
ncbi:hypothetical protein [Thiomicrospira sp. WB1]|uniref:hypothetical protein n=1 Tax=Thiomicrospira sp. WB1 TaxID=1685380 RepID=UPI00074A625E|nr:hypothetical protein [Thiomicrospira sp. WB1]KUJ71228.1 hypothetical protein AVO41_10245 [Thiomicrospira sp. WB1]